MRRDRGGNMSFAQRKRGRRLQVGVLFAVALLATLSSCASAPIGPAFLRASDPARHRGRIYLYREDARSSLSALKVSIAGRELGTLRDGEYETLELHAGGHELRVGLRSLAFVAWGWNEQRIRLEPGETVYLKLSVRLTPHANPGGRSLEIAGRTGGAASENIFIQHQGEAAALRALSSTTRLVAKP
jgi:hypothetical protein